MAENNVIPFPSSFDAPESTSDKNSISSGGGGGGPTVDTETKDFVEANMRAVKAENDARFTNVLSKLDNLKYDIDSKREPPSIWQITFGVAGVIGVFVAMIAFATNRFDAGMSSSHLVDEAVSRIEESQAKRDAEQDARLGLILKTLERQIETMQQKTPPTGQ